LLSIRKIFAVLNIIKVATEKILNDCALKKIITVETE